MPNAAPHPCGKPGCRALLPRRVRYCEKHRRESHRLIDSRRGSSAERGYDHDWREARQAWLLAHPLCVECEQEGRTTPASVVDHIVPISEAPERRLDRTNFRSLCKKHHDRRTAREQGFARGRGRSSAGDFS